MSSYNTNNNQNHNNGQFGPAANAFFTMFGGAVLAVPAWWLGISMCKGGSKGILRDLGGIVILVAIVLSIFTLKFFIQWIIELGKSIRRGARGESKPGSARQAATVAILVILAGIGLFGLIKIVRDAKADVEAKRTNMNSWSTSKSYSGSSGSSSTSKSSTSKTTKRDTSYNAKHSTYNRSSSSSSSKSKIDPDDLDIEGYYADYKDEFESVEDAWDDLMDNPDLWEDYD